MFVYNGTEKSVSVRIDSEARRRERICDCGENSLRRTKRIDVRAEIQNLVGFDSPTLRGFVHSSTVLDVNQLPCTRSFFHFCVTHSAVENFPWHARRSTRFHRAASCI